MGDGETVVCRTPGTPYEDRFGMKSSPDCGHTYDAPGQAPGAGDVVLAGRLVRHRAERVDPAVVLGHRAGHHR